MQIAVLRENKFIASFAVTLAAHCRSFPMGEGIKAKFHYTDTDTDTVLFAAKLRWDRAGQF